MGTWCGFVCGSQVTQQDLAQVLAAAAFAVWQYMLTYPCSAVITTKRCKYKKMTGKIDTNLHAKPKGVDVTTGDRNALGEACARLVDPTQVDARPRVSRELVGIRRAGDVQTRRCVDGPNANLKGVPLTASRRSVKKIRWTWLPPLDGKIGTVGEPQGVAPILGEEKVPGVCLRVRL
jgi:hypothetical protein